MPDTERRVRTVRRLVATCGFMFLSLLLRASISYACDPVMPAPFVLDPSSPRRTPPRITRVLVEVSRGDPWAMSTSCDGLSAISLTVSLAKDDEVGLRVEAAGGKVPPSLDLPYYQSPAALEGGRLSLPWFTDGAAVDFRLKLTPVSRSGAAGTAYVVQVRAAALRQRDGRGARVAPSRVRP